MRLFVSWMFASKNYCKFRVSGALAVTCVTFLAASGQQYTPLVQENATWILWYSPDDFVDFYYSAYRIEGDTSLGGQSYKKVYSYNLEPNQTDPYVIKGKNFAALVREDEELRQVYGRYDAPVFCEYQVENEAVLFDFSASVGDTVFDCHLDTVEFPTGAVIATDTALLRFGQERRVLINDHGLELMEGIGYEKGLFQVANTIIHSGTGYGLSEFCIGDFADCNITTSTTDPAGSVPIRIFPNPARNALNIVTPKEIQEIRIYDALGRLVERTNTLRINLHRKYPAGLYHVFIALERGQVYSEKLIVIE